MKRTRWILVLLSAVLLLTLTACGEPEPEVSVSVTLVNRSGRDISSISITPSTSSDWDTEFVDGMFHDGESIESGLEVRFFSFQSKFEVGSQRIGVECRYEDSLRGNRRVGDDVIRTLFDKRKNTGFQQSGFHSISIH